MNIAVEMAWYLVTWLILVGGILSLCLLPATFGMIVFGMGPRRWTLSSLIILVILFGCAFGIVRIWPWL